MGSVFITLEGIEGSGKSTQLGKLAERIPNALATKEPGGTPTADRIRAILLDTAATIDPVAELFLFAASRRQHVMEVIRPALAARRVVFPRLDAVMRVLTDRALYRPGEKIQVSAVGTQALGERLQFFELVELDQQEAEE